MHAIRHSSGIPQAQPGAVSLIVFQHIREIVAVQGGLSSPDALYDSG